MFLEMKKASQFLAIILAIIMIFTGFCAPGIGSINAYADDSITTVPVTKVAIQGQLKVGETVTAVATGANDEPATNVTYEWQYEDSYYDDFDGDVVEYNPISGETNSTFKIPNSVKGKKIRVVVKGDNGSTATSEISSEIAADTSSDMKTLEDILKDYQFGALTPEFGLDNNIVTFLDKKIKEKYEGVNVKLKSSSMPETVATNGDITYFYKDIDAGGITTSNNYVQPQMVFTLSKGASSVELTKKANIYWDIDKLKADLNKYIFNNLTQEELKGENTDLNNVKSDLTLPAKLENKTYANICWKSSDSSVIKIKEEGDSWNPDYTYKGIVKQGTEDKNVTLTATVEYIFTNTDLQKTKISKLKKEFTVTVKANSTDVLQEMQNELNANYTIDKIKDSVSGAVIEPGNITGDIQFLSPSKTGIANSDLYRFTVTSSDLDVLKVNGYRGIIYRPLPGEADKNVKFTVTMAQKEGALSVSKDFSITVKPLVQKDIDNEIKLMEKVKASYFDGIKAENSSKENIVTNMHAFREAAFTADGETLEWVYNSTNDKKKGIEPVELPGYDSMGGASWRLFRSSRSDIIQDENLLVKKPKYNTKVTIDSMLSSIEYAKYAEKYKDNQDFKKLVNQPVSTVVIVPGTDGENPNAETKKIKVFASLYDGRNSIFPVPFGEIEVNAGLAKSYGYTNAHIEKHAAENEVTMFDTLVAMHAVAMGITSPKEENATKTIQDILSIGDSGFLGKIMNENAPFSLMKNGRMPNDGVYNEQYKAYNGYTVDNAVVDNSDVLNYFFFQNSAYGDYYSWFEKNGIEVRALTVSKDEMVTLDLKGYMAMPYGCSTEEKIKEMSTGLDGIQLAFCDNTGTFMDIGGAVTSNGKASFTVDTKGEYIISAKGNGKTPLVAPYLKLTVTDEIAADEKKQIIAADKEALDFDVIKGQNEDSQTITENLKLIKIGNSGKTKITWTSSDASVIATDGTVKRPLSEAGDKAVTITAMISYGSVTDTKTIELKVSKLPPSDKAIDDIVAKLPKTIMPKEWDDSALAKQDTNIIEMVRRLVKAENPTAGVATVCVPSEEQTQISADGTITYGAEDVNDKKVTFTIQLGATRKEYSPEVTVNAKKTTNDEDEKRNDAYELMDNITAGYAAKDATWWGGRSTGTFWNAIGMEAYKNYNTNTKNVISTDAKQAFVNKMIALAVEGDVKASVNANIQANAINGLSAMGYDASQLWTVNHSKFSAVEKLNTVNLEEAKTGWYSTIAPYVVTAFRQGSYNTKAQENAHIEYLKEQLANDSNWNYGVDTPAMIMQGLTPYYDRAEVKTAVDIAITQLSAKQGANGSFGNASADAMVIVSLAQLGINPVTDERFIKEGHTLLDGLLLYKTDDNKGFVYNKEYNEISTYQGLLGLIAAINVMDSGKPYNVYDFSKTAKVEAYANGTIAVEDEEPTEEPIDDKNITISFTLKADKGTWIPATTLTLKKDSKVYHAFVKALDDAGFTYVGAGNNYVSSITNKKGTTLAEFTNGRNSGWLYTVNGSAPSIGLKDYKLNDGDKLVWYYTNDWTKDPEAVKAAGGKSAIAEFVEKEKATGKTEVQATTDKNGKASAEVKTKDINDVIEAVVKASEKAGAKDKKEVKIVVKADDKAKEVETKLPKDSMVELNKKVDVVTVQTPLADISFDKQNLELMSKNINGDVKLSVRKVDIANEGNFSEESKSKIKERVGDRPIFDFNLTVGDKKISNFADNVQVSIPYTASQNENVNGIVVYYINDNGNLETVKDCKYDSKTKALTFSTNHFSNYAVGYKNISFDDISKHWAKDQIVYLAARDVVKGVNNVGFAPNDKVTRAEFVQILANLSGVDLSKYADSKFKDVKKEAWFASSAAWAAEMGLVTGNSNNDGTVSFNPNESITRQDMAVILSRYMSKIEQKKLSEVNKEVKFADKNQIGGYAESAVAELQKAGVINGKTTDDFAPKENATRAECSKMISVLMQNYL